MKLGTVVSIFQENWQELFTPLLSANFDYFELLPENSRAFTFEELQQFFNETEIIVHAPFVEANLVTNSPKLQVVSADYLCDRLQPLVSIFDPQVITTHLGHYPFYQSDLQFKETKRIFEQLPTASFENMPGGSNLWRHSYPATEAECDYVLKNVTSRMTFDIGHFAKQDLDVYSLLEKYLPNLVDIHIHDFLDGQDHLPLGEGELDFPRIITILKNHDYQGYLSLELHHDNVVGMIDSLHRLRALTLD